MQHRRLLTLTGLTVAVVAVIIGALLAVRSETMQALLGRWSFVKSVTNDNSTYYRLKVKLAYKGEPQDFDIVVGCNVHQITYKDNSRTYEVGLIPTVFGRRMSDGKGLVVRPPNACRGETTANGRVQPDLLPLVIVYDNADRLDFGIAYLSEDAYESPLSVLKFGGATIEKATRPEFEAFRQTQANLVTRAKYHSAASANALKQLGLAQVAERWAYVCESYARFRIPADLRQSVARYWPAERPEYWLIDSYASESEVSFALRNSRSIENDRDSGPRPFLAFGNPGDGAADLGFPTRGGGGRVSATRGGVPESYYPVSTDYRSDQWPSERKDWTRYIQGHGSFADINVAFRGTSARGFAYCFATVRDAPPGNSQEIGPDQRIAGRVDDERISSKRVAVGPFLRPHLIFERDEYFWLFVRVFLGSPRGDV
jgi:hypothetical protein